MAKCIIDRLNKFDNFLLSYCLQYAIFNFFGYSTILVLSFKPLFTFIL